MKESQCLIIGSGVAGLTLAIKMAEAFPKRIITIVTKAHESESNTKYAQGGVASVISEKKDSFQKHIADTLLAGDGMCDPNIVEMVVKEGPERLRELIEWGVRFDKDLHGNFSLGREGGHSEYRVLHHKDATGSEIERALLQRVHALDNIELLSHHFAVDLILESHPLHASNTPSACLGAYVLDQISGEICALRAASVVLATGGLGRIYGHTTNPMVATGDGIAMAYRANARIRDMEFIQFHPTALYEEKETPSFLISEAVRGFGAYLRNTNGERFMLHNHEDAELASRDIVARAIHAEIKKEHIPYVYLDCTHLKTETFKQKFPTIFTNCSRLGIDVSQDWIPVVPAAHYVCGGIEVDSWGRTSINNLFACGECSRTGLHGANRLASNSLLEALVYAHRIFRYHIKQDLKSITEEPPQWKQNKKSGPAEETILQSKILELQQLMRCNAGIVRSTHELTTALKMLAMLRADTEILFERHTLTSTLCELRNMLSVAYLIIDHSLQRTENKGGYYNINYSEKINTLV
ncbi:L-aspartate oxidase [Altibacter sp.]|uniref:L-aspartate oxidase n=1 Tax=Altibacter sp. TaxID=2024823 RepID=UPI000C97AE1D|nr:L-aspartate oxidase [Altibacter sp.]MAP55066.1 L-aspartate oxidase [Altibacter sp.]